MIRSIRHKGLKRLYEGDDACGVIAEHATKLRDILARLDAARVPSDMDLPGFRLHSLKGDRKGFWAVTVAEIRGSFSALPPMRRSTLITRTITERSLSDADEESASSRRLCPTAVH